MRYAVGVDPGLKETGVVLCYDDKNLTPIAWATFTSPTGHIDLARVVSLASAVIALLDDWVGEYDIKELDVAIETPIFGRNVASYGKQMRLLQEIESGVFHIVAGELNECWVTEVNPVQSKILATGNPRAGKDLMVGCSPFENYIVRKSTLEAIADAWAHANAAWKGQKGAPRANFAAIHAAPIDHVHAGRAKELKDEDKKG
jgi:Holliday junction resolvasome RuvABC endonuclease subunit